MKVATFNVNGITARLPRLLEWLAESLGGAAFKVENPQAAAGCGCGSSFGI